MGLAAAWSYSALTAFETCPHRYNLTRVTKQVAEPQNEASIWGNRVHNALEKRAKGTAALPKEMQKYDKYVQKILSYKGKRIIEAKLAIDKNLRPSKWMGNNTWCRGIIDIGVVGESTAYLLDWKTGKRKFDDSQLMLFSLLAFAHYPWIDKAVTGFIWLKDGKFDKNVFTREQIPELWNEFLPRIARLENAYDKDKWIAKPSGLCKDWCPVGRGLCEFCGQ